MLGQPPRNDKDRIYAHVVAGPGKARCKLLGGNRDAAQALVVERHGRGVGGGALFDLDEGNDAAATGDQVDLAAAHLHPPGEDPPAVEPEPPGGNRLGAAAATLGLAAFQLAEPIAIARA